MIQQWSISTTVFHTITGDKDLMEANKDKILELINNLVGSALVDADGSGELIAGVTMVEDHVCDPEVICATDISEVG